jgi:hypothetical protein
MTAAPVDKTPPAAWVAALEHAWTAIPSHYADVPQVVIVVASGSAPRQAAQLRARPVWNTGRAHKPPRPGQP